MITKPSARALLAWYDRHRRDLPWRARPGERRDPYAVWLSEIMLQQTTTATVAPYFERFLRRWPDIEALAAAPLDEVLAAWAGLGYYRRARNLHACAVLVARDHGGRFPADEAGLLALPGIGRYSAAAIAAIAFDRRAVVVDGNVERVMARLFRLRDKRAAYGAMDRLTPAQRVGDFAQGVMDLGATICTPRQPACASCPWRACCQARAAGEVERYPVKAIKRPKRRRRAIAFVMTDAKGRVWLRRRPEQGLLAGLLEVPTTPWIDPADHLDDTPPVAARWRIVPGAVRHVFTHLDLTLEVRRAKLARAPRGEGAWHAIDRLSGAALPTLMRKVLAHAGIDASTPPRSPAPGHRSDAPAARPGNARPRARPGASARR